MIFFRLKSKSPFCLHLFAGKLISCIWLLSSFSIQVYADSSDNSENPEFYDEVATIFLATFSDTSEKLKVKKDKGMIKRGKVHIPIPSDRALMRTILYNIYRYSSPVDTLFDKEDFIVDAKSLKNLNIIHGPDENPDHHMINSLNTAGIHGSMGMGYFAKSAMFIDLVTAKTDPVYLENQKGIIKNLAKKKKRLRKLIRLFDEFNEESEKFFITYYQDKERHPLRGSQQLNRFNYYVLNLDLAKSPLWLLHLLQKLTTSVPILLSIMGLIVELNSLRYQWLYYTKHKEEIKAKQNDNKKKGAIYAERLSFGNTSAGILMSILSLPFGIVQSYILAKDMLSSYSRAFYHQQKRYKLAEMIYNIVQSDDELKVFCKDLLTNIEKLIKGKHDDPYLKEFVSLLKKCKNLKDYSFFLSLSGDRFKLAGLFEKCYDNPILCGAIFEIAQFEVRLRLAYYMSYRKEAKNTLCYTTFVDPQKHPEAFIDVEGLWNVNLNPEVAVPNDVFMDGKDTNLHFLLGSNAGGKTTHMKSLSILSQTYGISPAKKSIHSIFHRICTYFDPQSNIAKKLSGYTSQLERMEYIIAFLKKIGRDKNVLCLIDEPCTGTGEFLAKILTIEFAKYLSEEFPNVSCFIITHHEAARKLEKKNDKIKNYKVDILHGKDYDFVFTYKIVQGTPSIEDDMVALKYINKWGKFPKKLIKNINRSVKKALKKKKKNVLKRLMSFIFGS